MPAPPRDQPVTIVSGLPRSGTSLMMSMLRAGGLAVLTDGAREADEDNRRGYFEYEPVKASAADASWIAEAPGKAVKVILPLLRFLPADVHYRVVLMRRELGEVIESQRVMLERAGKRGGRLEPAELCRLYEAEHRKAEAWLDAQPRATRLAVSYNELLARPEPVIAALDEFLGGGLDRAAMLATIDPALYRQRAASSNAAALREASR